MERRKTEILYIFQIPLNSKIKLTWGFPNQVNELHVEFNCKIKYFTLLQTLLHTPHTPQHTILLLSSNVFPHTLFYLSLKTTAQVRQVRYYYLRFPGDTMKEPKIKYLLKVLPKSDGSRTRPQISCPLVLISVHSVEAPTPHLAVKHPWERELWLRGCLRVSSIR